MSFKDARKGTTLAVVQVVRSERISPHFVRVTVGGEQLAPLPDHGFDHWFRLFLPKEQGETSFALPEQLGMAGYLKYLRMPAQTRPILRNYTVREFRPAEQELDIDFVVHGDVGVANRWAQRTGPGDTVALLDQGRGYEPLPGTGFHLLVADETGLPAVLGILRSLPRDAKGLAIVELADMADAQEAEPPDGVELRWVVRGEGVDPGAAALAMVRGWTPERPAALSAYAVGEQQLPVGVRRHLVAAGVPKPRITFVGYWRLGKAQY